MKGIKSRTGHATTNGMTRLEVVRELIREVGNEVVDLELLLLSCNCSSCLAICL